MKEYKIEVKVKNNLILQRIVEHGFSSVGEFCKFHKIAYQSVTSIINMIRAEY